MTVSKPWRRDPISRRRGFLRLAEAGQDPGPSLEKTTFSVDNAARLEALSDSNKSSTIV